MFRRISDTHPALYPSMVYIPLPPTIHGRLYEVADNSNNCIASDLTLIRNADPKIYQLKGPEMFSLAVLSQPYNLQHVFHCFW